MKKVASKSELGIQKQILMDNFYNPKRHRDVDLMDTIKQYLLHNYYSKAVQVYNVEHSWFQIYLDPFKGQD